MIVLTWILSVVSVLGVGGAIVAMVFFPTVAVPVLEKVVQLVLGCKWCLIVTAFLLSTLGSFWYGHHGQYAKGYDKALSDIAAEDASAIKRATEKRAVWRECRARSGTWNQTTGECQ